MFKSHSYFYYITYIYIVPNKNQFQLNAFIWTFYSLKNPDKKCHGFHKNVKNKSRECVWTVRRNREQVVCERGLDLISCGSVLTAGGRQPNWSTSRNEDKLLH